MTALPPSLPGGARSIMASRREPPDSLDFFPTPPWATRAMLKIMQLRGWLEPGMVFRCPAAGEGHMAEVIRELGRFPVLASDVFDYGVGYKVASYVGDGPDVLRDDVRPAWVMENPPFNLIPEFLDRAMSEAQVGVAFLVRAQWFHTVGRYDEIFGRRAPTHVFHYSERVPMQKGWWDPNGSTATDYSWAVWSPSALHKWRAGINVTRPYEGNWIPPGQRELLTLQGDAERFPDRRSPEEKARAAEAAARRKAARDQAGLALLPPEGRA